MTYVVEYTTRAQKDLKKIPLEETKKIIRTVYTYTHDSNPLEHAKKLKSPYEHTWRFRIGDYRVLFEVLKTEVHILNVLRVRHRKDVYK